jgi:hypothetical protein
MRFSLRWLFLVTAFVAISCACLVYATQPVYIWLGIAMQAYLVLSILGAIYAPRDRRAFWGGCAIIGCAYFWNGHTVSHIVDPRHLENLVLDKIYPMVVRETTGRPWRSDFNMTGEQLATLIAAFTGGFIGLWFGSPARRSAMPPNSSIP